MQIGIINQDEQETRFITETLQSSPYCEFCWTATSAAEGLELIANHQPELLIINVTLPGNNLPALIKQLVSIRGIAVLVSTQSVEHHTSRVFQAMGAGALDVVTLPCPEASSDPVHAQHLQQKISTVNRLLNTGNQKNGSQKSTSLKNTPLIAIGSSTGGPAALVEILKNIPNPFAASIVIVQHLDAQFSNGFAQWLNEQSRLPVRIAQAGGHPTSGIVHIAGTGDHLVINGAGKFQYEKEPIDYVYRPSANEFFQSLVKNWHGPAIGLLLTGMGKDGATGLLAMRNKGYHTIAEAEETCAVFGMPKAAIEMNAADTILPLQKIAPFLMELLRVIQEESIANG